MLAVLALLQVVASAPLAPRMPSPAAELVDATVNVCLPVAKNELKLSGRLDEDAKQLKLRHLSQGVSQVVMDQLGRAGLGFLSQSLIGERRVGEDAIIVAIGGAMPGCRSILLSKSDNGLSDQVSEMLEMNGFREAPATNKADAAVRRRMFVRLDRAGTPYLINMFTGSLPQSAFRLMTTVNRIPAGVQLPQGF